MTLFRCKPLAIELSEGVSPKTVQVLRTGTFHHAQYGTFEITPATLLSMKKNFDAKIRGVDLAIDYGHESDRNAAGWIEDLELKENDTQLWARVRWTPKGGDMVMGQEYRYLSADFSFDYQDGETLQKFGPTLLGAGLTNRPVVKGMAPVELSEGTNEMDKDKLIAELQAKVAELQKALEAKKPEGENEIEVEMSAMKKKLAEYEAAEAAAKEMACKAEAEKKLAEKKDAFTKLLSEGKAVEAQREAFMSDDMGKFVELAQPLNLSEKGHGKEDTGVVDQVEEGKTAGQTFIKLAEQKMLSDKISLSDAIGKLRKEKPELYTKYLEEVKVN